MVVEIPESLRPTVRSAVVLVLVFAIGTVGYHLLGGAEHTWIDALYMTTITLTTVGYGETIEVAGRPAAQLFTVFLLVSGAGTFLYFFSNLTAFLVEGALHQIFRRRRMTRWIDQLEGHHIVCGGGHSGEVVVRELVDTGRPFVVIEEQESRMEELVKKIGQEIPFVVGDATEDDVLKAAGIERARGLVSCIGNDKDNVLVVFTARALQPGLRIVARSLESVYEHKLRRAGADAVVSPERIGGLRMVSASIRPTAVSFLDLMLRDSGAAWRIEEVTVAAGSSVEDMTVAGVRDLGIEDLLLMAVRDPAGRWIFNPDSGQALPAESSVVFLASPEGRARLEQVTRV